MPTGQGQRGNIGDKVDRDLLHEYMWKRSDHNGLFRQSQKELAQGLGVTQSTMSQIIRELAVTGRVRQVGWKIFVIDPELWRWRNPVPTQPQLL